MISLAFSRAGSRTNASAPTISIIKPAISYHKYSLTPFAAILQLSVVQNGGKNSDRKKKSREQIKRGAVVESTSEV